MEDIKAKQQVVEKIKSASKILITVSNDPSLDALSAALGLALVVNKLDKHATAIFSGQAPQAMQFLEPDKTFEHTIDSLRDFIVALDKEKADHLRLKVEGEIAKIYITPYRTTITADDLTFSQGDYNVELVIALGVENQDHLDDALDAHGQILHDAPIVSITSGDQVSKLGGVDWHDSRASSLSEMVTTLAEALKDQDRLIDKQSATALLTGIVAATERFSNPKTTSVSMTVAAQLMADGADQQLIAAELEKSQEIIDSPVVTSSQDNAYGVSDDGQEVTASLRGGGAESLADLDARVRGHEETPVTPMEAPVPSVIEPVIEANPGDTANAYGIPGDASAPAPSEEALPVSPQIITDHPSSAYLAEPEVATEKAPGTAPEATSAYAPEQPAAGSAYAFEETPTEEPASVPEQTPLEPAAEPISAPEPVPEVTPAQETTSQPELTPQAPSASTPAELGLPMPPPLPDFSTPVGELSNAYAPPAPQPELLGDILAEPAPSAPSPAPEPLPEPVIPPMPTANDPAQFKIPGQP